MSQLQEQKYFAGSQGMSGERFFIIVFGSFIIIWIPLTPQDMKMNLTKKENLKQFKVKSTVVKKQLQKSKM